MLNWFQKLFQNDIHDATEKQDIINGKMFVIFYKTHLTYSALWKWLKKLIKCEPLQKGVSWFFC